MFGSQANVRSEPSRAARVCRARLAHVVEEASLLPGLLTAVELRLQFFHPGVGALERLVLNECGLHQSIDRVWRAAKPVRDRTLGLRIARSVFHTRQAVEQFVDQGLFLRRDCSSPLQLPSMWGCNRHPGGGSQKCRPALNGHHEEQNFSWSLFAR
jgi:hypothetical protein